jgi:hypothetical protein
MTQSNTRPNPALAAALQRVAHRGNNVLNAYQTAFELRHCGPAYRAADRRDAALMRNRTAARFAPMTRNAVTLAEAYGSTVRATTHDPYAGQRGMTCSCANCVHVSYQTLRGMEKHDARDAYLMREHARITRESCETYAQCLICFGVR